MKVPIASPPTGAAVVAAAVRVVESGVWANGPEARALEAEFADFCGARHCVAVSSGTASLVLIGEALGLRADDRVLVPAFTFAATANAFLSLGCRVECVDVDPITFNIDAERLAEALRVPTRAVVVVDLYGNAAGTDAAFALAADAGAALVEDAAQAHGAHDASGAMVGARAGAYATSFSLYATKNLAAGEGGLITTEDDAVAARLLELRSHGASTTYVHRRVGLNHRITEVAAALARAQLPDLEQGNERRRAIAARLDEWCRDAWGDAVRLPARDRQDHVLHQYTVVFGGPEQRDRVAVALREHGVDARVFYPYTVAELPGVTPSDVPVAAALRDTVLSLPVHPQLDDAQLDTLRDAIAASRHP